MASERLSAKHYAVKETLAEYFALCCYKDKNSTIDSRMDIAENIHTMRGYEGFSK